MAENLTKQFQNQFTHETISKSIQLIAGRTGQEYNQRKNRKGAFWEDRYHATAIQSDNHLFQCICYIDMNMVRAGDPNAPLKNKFREQKEYYNSDSSSPKAYNGTKIYSDCWRK